MESKLKIVILIVFIVFVETLYGQEQKDTLIKLESFLKVKVGDYSGLEWEGKIGKKSLVDLFGGAVIALQSDGFSFSASSFNSRIIIEPAIYSEYKYCYNYLKRRNNNKIYMNNSTDFLFFRVSSFLPIKNQNEFNLLFTEGWGLQRAIIRKLSIDCHLGVIEHFYFDKYYYAPKPHFGFNYIKLEPLTSFSLFYIF